MRGMPSLGVGGLVRVVVCKGLTPAMAQLPSPQPGAAAGRNGDDEVDFRRLADVLLAGKWFVAAVTVLFVAVGFAYGHLATPVYRGDVLLQVKQAEGQVPGLTDRGYIAESESVAAEIEVLRSRMVAGRVVEELGLQIVVEPERAPLLGGFLARSHASDGPAPPPSGVNWLDRLDLDNWLDLNLERYGWGGETLTVAALDGEGVTNRRFILVAQDAGRYELYDAEDNFLVEGRVGETAVVEDGAGLVPPFEILVSDLNARPGMRFKVMKQDFESAANRVRGRLEIMESRAGAGMMQVSMEGEDREQLGPILGAVAKAYLRQNNKHRTAAVQKRLDFLESHLPELRADLHDAEDAYNRFHTENQSVDLTAESGQLLNEMFRVETELARLDLQQIEARQRYSERHPQIQELRQEEEALREVKAKLTSRAEELPRKQQQALRLSREMEVTSALYTSLLTTAQELQVARAGTTGSARILDEAVVSGPVKPRRQLIMLTSLMLGLMAGVGGVFARHALTRSLGNPDQLERQFDLPVHAIVPHSSLQESSDRRAQRRGRPRPVLARDRPQEPAAESVRNLRTSLHVALPPDGCNVIALTSPSPRCGKSFICVNLAWLMAETDRRVLLIDADMRRGRLHSFLGRERGPGLSEVLRGRCRPAEALMPLDANVGRIDVMPTGSLPRNPSELLMSPLFRDLLEWAKVEYDFVIVDTPPMLAVTDAAIVGTHASAVFVVLRTGVSGVDEVEPTLRCLRQNGSPAKGFLVNDFAQRSYSASYYHTYSYPTATR